MLHACAGWAGVGEEARGGGWLCPPCPPYPYIAHPHIHTSDPRTRGACLPPHSRHKDTGAKERETMAWAWMFDVQSIIIGTPPQQSPDPAPPSLTSRVTSTPLAPVPHVSSFPSPPYPHHHHNNRDVSPDPGLQAPEQTTLLSPSSFPKVLQVTSPPRPSSFLPFLVSE